MHRFLSHDNGQLIWSSAPLLCINHWMIKWHLAAVHYYSALSARNDVYLHQSATTTCWFNVLVDRVCSDTSNMANTKSLRHWPLHHHHVVANRCTTLAKSNSFWGGHDCNRIVLYWPMNHKYILLIVIILHMAKMERSNYSIVTSLYALT